MPLRINAAGVQDLFLLCSISALGGNLRVKAAAQHWALVGISNAFNRRGIETVQNARDSASLISWPFRGCPSRQDPDTVGLHGPIVCSTVDVRSDGLGNLVSGSTGGVERGVGPVGSVDGVG